MTGQREGTGASNASLRPTPKSADTEWEGVCSTCDGYLTGHRPGCPETPRAEPAVPAKPKIYAFSNAPGGGDGIAYAMAEDGAVLASHWCSAERYVPYDLGMIEGARQDVRDAYAAHFPDGYEIEFVPARDVASHPGVAAAYERNQARAAISKATSQSGGEG